MAFSSVVSVNHPLDLIPLDLLSLFVSLRFLLNLFLSYKMQITQRYIDFVKKFSHIVLYKEDNFYFVLNCLR